MDDLISRQAVKEWLAKWEGYIDADIIARMQYRIIDIPSAQPEPSAEYCACCVLSKPERKKGNWVAISDEPDDVWECDNCGFVIDGSGCIDPYEYRDVYKFCANSGAEMREGQYDSI